MHSPHHSSPQKGTIMDYAAPRRLTGRPQPIKRPSYFNFRFLVSPVLTLSDCLTSRSRSSRCLSELTYVESDRSASSVDFPDVLSFTISACWPATICLALAVRCAARINPGFLLGIGLGSRQWITPECAERCLKTNALRTPPTGSPHAALGANIEGGGTITFDTLRQCENLPKIC